MVLVLLVLVFLPRHFSIQQTSDLRGSDEQVRPLLFDLKLWPQLMAWDKFSSKLSIDISSPSNTLGANVFLQTSSADIEITITEISQSQLQYSILINNEHALLGSLSLIHNDNELTINHSLKGTIHSTVSGGIIVLYIRSLADKMFTSSINNLRSHIQLADKDMQ